MSQKIKVKKLQNSPYVIACEQVIGKGSFSTIVKAYNLQNPKEQLVSKIINVKDAQSSITIKTQLQILKKLPHHPNLVNCIKFQISSQNNFYLIMEYCNEGNLDKYMVRKKFNIPEEKIWFFLKQFCDGYRVLYNNGVVHRDIKPENILIHNGDFKIADFGLSKNIDDMEIVTNMSAKGTPLYMAPQIHQEKEGSSKIDIFSLGVVLYRMTFNGQYPFFDQGRKYRSINEYFKQLMLRKLAIPQNHKRSPQLVALIQNMLIKDKQKRISWKQIFQMDQIKNAIRFQRKKQLTPMDQLRRSLMIVNKSQTQVRIIQSPQDQNQSPESTEMTSIILEETFNKTNKSKFQKNLFKNKLLYTLIQYTNKKVEKFVKKTSLINAQDQPPQSAQNGEYKKARDSPQHKYEKLYGHICKHFCRIIEQGVIFSLYVITKLQQISGDWTQLSQGQIMNFEDIFENDKGIFIEHYKQIKSAKQGKVTQQKTQEGSKKQELPEPTYIPGTYQDTLYSTLSQYFEYPTDVRIQLRSIFALLVNIYDLTIKSQTAEPPNKKLYLSKQKHKQQDDKNLVEKAQDQTTIEFYQYLIDIQSVEERELKDQMHKKGLVFM